MNLQMRITFDEKDYTYVVLTKGITRETNAIQNSLNNTEYQLICNSKGGWDVDEATVTDQNGLLKTIGRNIKLKYRL
jgi:hypothetical protein